MEIEQYSDLGSQLKGKPGSRHSCILSILSTNRHAAFQDTNLPFSPSDCRVKIRVFWCPLPESFAFKKRDQICTIDVFPQNVACILKNLLDLTPAKNLSYAD